MTSLVDGIPSTDMTTAVQTSLGKADTALQEHQDITGKEDKTNKVTTVDENSTNTQYPSAKLFYDTTTDLQTKYETLKNDHPDIEEEGTELTLNGTGDFDLALSPKGNITQEATQGYNIAEIIREPITSNGVTFTPLADGGIKIQGTLTTGGQYRILTLANIPIVKAGKTYTRIATVKGTLNKNSKYVLISGRNSGGTDIMGDMNIASNETTYSTSNISSDETMGGITIYSSGDGVVFDCVLYFMLVEGTYSSSNPLAFEKYTGGQASPSPSYPSPVKVVDGEYEVEVENKNLFDNNLENGSIDTNGNNNDNVTLYNKRLRTTDYIEIDNETYIISCKETGLQIYVYCYDINKSFLGYIGNVWNNIPYTFTKLSGTEYVRFVFRKSSDTSITVNDISNIQIEEGSTATSYIAHAEQTQTIDTSPNPLYSEDDYYYKSNGEWYVHNEFKKIVLNGTTSPVTYIKLGNVINTGFIVPNDIKVPANNDTAGNLKSNYFISKSINYLYNNKAIGIGLRTDKVLFLSFGEDANYSTTEAINTWLSTHNTEIIYELATPTNTKITNTTLINSLEALQNMLSYQDQTNISQTHNEAQADMIINAKTIMSMRYLQNEIEELKQAILNS